MGCFDTINVKITGQVAGDYNDNEKEVVLAKLQVICAEHGLEMEQ